MSVQIDINPEIYVINDKRNIAKVKGTSVGECINDLVKQFPDIKAKLFDDSGNLHNYIDIYVNQKSSFPEELSMRVKDNDEIYITLIYAGG